LNVHSLVQLLSTCLFNSMNSHTTVSLEIIPNIELDLKRKERPNKKYPFSKMEIGDGFICNSGANVAHSALGQAKRYGWVPASYKISCRGNRVKRVA